MKNLIVFLLGFFPLLLFGQDLTGEWKCNDGGKYYLRQVNHELWWYGDGGSRWTNVFKGKIHGKSIYGDWADVPAGKGIGLGSMTLQIVSSNELKRIWTTGMFGGSVWTRQSSQPNVFDLRGQWTYAGTRGKISVRQSSDQVSMEFTIQPRTAPAPHYVVNATLHGNTLEGTWKFTVSNDPRFAGPNCQGGKFYAQVSPDGKKITVLPNTEDPCKHEWVGTEFFRG